MLDYIERREGLCGIERCRAQGDPGALVRPFDRLTEPKRLLIAELVDALDDVRELMDVVGRIDQVLPLVDRQRQRVERQRAVARVVEAPARNAKASSACRDRRQSCGGLRVAA